MTEAELHGVWLLREFTVRRPDGATVFPYGPNAMGTLLYTPQGWVSADLCRRDRGSGSTTTLERASRADAGERLQAYDGYTSYAGRYEIQEYLRDSTGPPQTEVLHHIEIALVPDMIGQTLRRVASWEGEALVLRYDVPTHNGADTYQLIWVKP